MMSRLLELPVKTVIPYVNSIIPDILFFFVLCFLLLSVFETFYCFFSVAIGKCRKGQERIFQVAACHHIPVTKRWSLLSLQSNSFASAFVCLFTR